MAEPSYYSGHPLLSIHFREATYGQTEKMGNDGGRRARRAFYKWVCKHELYGPLTYERESSGYYRHYRDIAKYCYGSPYLTGLPKFRHWNSAAYDRWDQEFQVRRNQILAARDSEHERKLDARMKVYMTMCNNEAQEFFQMHAAAGILSDPSNLKKKKK